MTWQEPARDWTAEDRKYGLPSDAAIERIAQAMDAEHNRRRQREGAVGDHVSQHRVMGLYGERHIARVFGLEMDLSIRPYGSQRKNMYLADGTTIDVVTRAPYGKGFYPDLIRKVNARGKVDALVLVVWHGRVFEPEAPGFMYERDLVALNRIKELRDGTPNYLAPIALLSPLRFLVQRHDPESTYAQEGSEWLLSSFADQQVKEVIPGNPTPSQPSLFDVSSVPEARLSRDRWRS